jgi:quercetin dioxygenase-like cupin family protein
MFQPRENGRSRRAILLAGIVLCAGVVATSASAAECPADQKMPNARQPVKVGNEGVTDTVIAMIDVDKEQGIKGRKFRMRKLTIAPGATVPWHSHAERPAIIYIIQGQIEEYASNCKVPIVQKAGDVVAETKGVSHWWKNTGDEEVVLISADLPKNPKDHTM